MLKPNLLQPEFNLTSGIDRKETGQDRVSEHAPTFTELMRDAARDIARAEGSVTSDDLRRFAASHGLIPHHPNAWGAVFRGEEWVSVGYTRSSLVSNHARTIRIWTYKQI